MTPDPSILSPSAGKTDVLKFLELSTVKFDIFVVKVKERFRRPIWNYCLKQCFGSSFRPEYHLVTG